MNEPIIKTEGSFNRGNVDFLLYENCLKVANAKYTVTNILINKIINLSKTDSFHDKNRAIRNFTPNKNDSNENSIYLYSIIPRAKDPLALDISVDLLSFKSSVQYEAFYSNLFSLIHNPELHRPKSLLVFINPIGGFKKGVKNYYDKVEPVLRLGGVHAEVTITQRKDEAMDKILNESVDLMDGIVVVGGDGMFMEVVHGLMIRERRSRGYSDEEHTINHEEFPTPVRIGIIPAGSTDSVVHSTNGTKDILTSTLSIVIGDTISIDSLVVYKNKAFLRYNVSLIGYGYFGNLISESESLRWMGPKRYDWLGFKSFLKLQSFNAEIQIIKAPKIAGEPSDGNLCHTDCQFCQNNYTETTDNDNNWFKLQGKFVAFNCFTMTCRCTKAQLGPAPYAHLSNGYTDLYLIRDCSRVNFLRYLINIPSLQPQHFNFDFIEVYRVKEFQFKLVAEKKPILNNTNNKLFNSSLSISISNSNSNSNTNTNSNSFNEPSKKIIKCQYDENNNCTICMKQSSGHHHRIPRDNFWNCDGEALIATKLHCIVHRKIIRMFSRGVPDKGGRTIHYVG